MIGIYKITNKTTGDYYIGSSKNVKQRWATHRCQSTWKHYPNKQLYIDMQKYGRDKFIIEVIEEVVIDQLHNREQYYIEQLQPVYNIRVADTGIDTNDMKKYKKQYQKQYQQQYQKQYRSQHTDDRKQYDKQYYIENTDKIKKQKKQYDNQQCNYNGEILTLCALRTRFKKQGIEHPTAEAKKYLINQK